MTAGCSFACYKSNLQFHLSCAFISPPRIYFHFHLFFFCFFFLSLKFLENCFERHLTYKKCILSTPLIPSWVSVHIYSNRLRQILHHPCTPPPRRAGGNLQHLRMPQPLCRSPPTFMQIPPTLQACAPDLDEPGKWLTSHLYATEREAGGLIWKSVWQAGEHRRGCIRLTLPQTSLIY